MKRYVLTTIALFSLTLLSLAHGYAQSFPTKPIRFVVPYAPGGSADTVTRIVAQKLTGSLGQEVLVDNRPGANGQIGMRIVAGAVPDGYTLVLGYITNIVIDPSLHKNLAYNPLRDFAPVTLLVSTPNVMVVHPSVPAKNLKELIAYAKANPGKINFTSSGVGSVGHLTGALLNRLAGIDMVHVQYKGSGQAVIDLLAGQVQMMFSGFSSTLQHIKAGKLRPLAVTGAKRSAGLPDVPTISESGFPGVEATAWHGMFAPAGTPKAVIRRLHDETVRALANPEVRERLAHLEFEIVGSTPEAFAAYIKTEFDKWVPAVKTAGIQTD